MGCTQNHHSDNLPPETISTTGQDQEHKPVTHTHRNKEREPWRVQIMRRPPQTHMIVAKGGRTRERRQNSTERRVFQKARRMGTDLATKTKKTMKHDQKISPQTNVSCLPFLPETQPKHKTKTLSTDSTNQRKQSLHSPKG